MRALYNSSRSLRVTTLKESRPSSGQTLSIPPLCDDSRCLYGEAVFNIEVSKPAGVFLLGGLEVATLGNGVFLHVAHPTYHAALFEQLARTLRRLHMQHQAVIS